MTDLSYPHIPNKHLFGGKEKKKDVYMKIAEQFTKASWSPGEATERGL